MSTIHNFYLCLINRITTTGTGRDTAPVQSRLYFPPVCPLSKPSDQFLVHVKLKSIASTFPAIGPNFKLLAIKVFYFVLFCFFFSHKILLKNITTRLKFAFGSDWLRQPFTSGLQIIAKVSCTIAGFLRPILNFQAFFF